MARRRDKQPEILPLRPIRREDVRQVVGEMFGRPPGAPPNTAENRPVAIDATGSADRRFGVASVATAPVVIEAPAPIAFEAPIQPQASATEATFIANQRTPIATEATAPVEIHSPVVTEAPSASEFPVATQATADTTKSAVLAAASSPSLSLQAGRMFRTMGGEMVSQRMIRPLRSIQDAHSTTEHLVYQTIWNRGAPHPGCKVAHLGYAELGSATGVPKRTLTRTIAELRRKGSIAIVNERDAALSQARTYAAWDMGVLLEAFRKAGYTHVFRNRGGVDLVRPVATEMPGPSMTTDPSISLPMPPIATLARQPIAPLTTDAIVATGPVVTEAAGPGATKATEPVASGSPVATKPAAPGVTETLGPVATVTTRLGSVLGNEQEPPSTTSATVLTALRTILGDIDDQAVSMIINGCRKHAPDATGEEIAHFASLVANRAVNIRSIQNPIGLVIVQTPGFFRGQAVQQFREEQRQRREAEAIRQMQAEEENRKWCESVLADPQSTEEERQLALELLGRTE